ncbi:MAG: alanine--tRNA ligase [Planctomycetes bacterium]|nr:alanine--tRNA ligase [Planctomycetota bacterium]
MSHSPNTRSAAQVRREFLQFFAERGHTVVPSAAVFPQDDPTLLFTNAGMNQFKDVFLGTGSRSYKRAVDTQKCIRVSGKHNDLEEVGVDTYHHTFFEMLGNWSFGDYFKAEAIPWAWELLTKVWGLPTERLWVTVFAGDEKDGLPPDKDAERIWIEKAGIAPQRVLRFGRKDNFWEMGATGPCGPCTEIHIDRGGPETNPADGADRKIGVNAGNERFIELWNNVFMEFNRLDDGSLKPLPAQSVDTGMGFERILSVLQGKRSNYDTDLFTPIFARLSQLANRPYGASNSRADIAFRVCADHARAVTAALSDGALPSNTGRGYVLRRLVRRAARFGRQELGLEEPFLFELVPTVAEVLGDAFPEMRARLEHVREMIKIEELSFGRTLGRGLVRFAELESGLQGKQTIPGAAAFELYATYGFPRDLIELMARERGLGVDAAQWDSAEKSHQDASRSEGKFKQLLSAEQLEGLAPTQSTYHDAGARSLTLESRVLFLAEDEPSKLVLAQSPFYAESGGQVGDRGLIRDPAGKWRFVVEETRKVGPIVVHLGRIEGALPASGATAIAEVDSGSRARTQKNHTATHLLHKALKEVLGEHIGQAGSYVGPDRLRFDFSHPKALSPEELERIEEIVNAHVFANHGVQTTLEELEAAKARGVTAMFGEKYDAQVRVLDVGGWSMELCGGTHVSASGDIGPFVITLERAVAAGVRRIEALTGPAAVEEIQRQRRRIVGTARLLKSAPDEVETRVEQLLAQLKEARKKGEKQSAGGIDAAFAQVKESLGTSGEWRHGVYAFADLDQNGVRELGERVKSLAPKMAVALFGRAEERVPFLILCPGAGKGSPLAAGELSKLVSIKLGGGGGGRPDLAQGQGLNAGPLPELLKELAERITTALSAVGAR